MSIQKGRAEITWIPELSLYKLKLGIDFKNSRHTDFISILKGLIPSSHRSYDPITKEWYFAPQYYEQILIMTGYCFHIGTVLTKEEYEKLQAEFTSQSNWGVPTTQTTSGESLLNTFVTIVGQALSLQLDPIQLETDFQEATRLYRKAAMKLHPDVNNGNAEQMSRLNETWALLKQYVYTSVVK